MANYTVTVDCGTNRADADKIVREIYGTLGVSLQHIKISQEEAPNKEILLRQTNAPKWVLGKVISGLNHGGYDCDQDDLNLGFLAVFSKDELRAMKGIGEETINEVIEILKHYGLELMA